MSARRFGNADPDRAGGKPARCSAASRVLATLPADLRIALLAPLSTGRAAVMPGSRARG